MAILYVIIGAVMTIGVILLRYYLAEYKKHPEITSFAIIAT